MGDVLLLQRTKRFSSFTLLHEQMKNSTSLIVVDLCCSYSKRILLNELTSNYLGSYTIIHEDCFLRLSSMGIFPHPITQWADFESILWPQVLSNLHNKSSSYLIRKGLSRKAQFSYQLKKFTCKNKSSILHTAIPFTVIIDTWSAFEEMKLDFGGGLLCSFDNSMVVNTPLRHKLEFILEDVKEIMNDTLREDWIWILKPSVVNKGIGISVIRKWDQLLDALEAEQDIREWVLQRYIENPLLISNHKFHVRTYILCVGALQVYVFDEMLLLLAAHP
jgi:tubulin--tyrosine ligase